MNCYPNSQFNNFNQGCIVLPNFHILHVDTNFNNEYGYFNTSQPQQNIPGNLPQEDIPEDEEQSSNSDSSSSKKKGDNNYIIWNVGLPKPVLPDYNNIKVVNNSKVPYGKLNETYSIIPLYSFEEKRIFDPEAEPKKDSIYCSYCKDYVKYKPKNINDHLESDKHARAVCYVYYQNKIKYPGCVDTSYDEKNISDAIFPVKHPKKLKTKEEKERYVQWLKDNHIINFYTDKVKYLTRVQLEKENTSKSPTSSNSSSTLPR